MMYITKIKNLLPSAVLNFLRHYLNKTKYVIFRIKKFGFLKTLKELLPVYIRNIGSIFISIPVVLLIFMLIPLIQIRFVRLLSERLGHFALNTEIMLCAFDIDILNKYGKDGRVKYFFYTDTVISNKFLYKMWKRVLPILPFPTILTQVNKVLSFLSSQYKNDKLKNTVEQGIWADDKLRLMERVPYQHVFFTKKEEKRGIALMSELGIPHDARYVCLAVRDSYYMKKRFPCYDWSYHDHRNADIMTYRKGALFLVDKGYYVIRMGKWVKGSFDLADARIIDYANSPLQSDFLDVYLASKCEFFISTSTGIDAVPQIFRRPVLFSNISLSRELQAYYAESLFIPKLIRNKKTEKFLTFNEINKFMSHHEKPGVILDILKLLEKHDLELMNNTEDDILDLTQEMHDRLNAVSSQEDHFDLERQKNFWMQYRFNPERVLSDIRVKIGSGFLKKYYFLLANNL